MTSFGKVMTTLGLALTMAVAPGMALTGCSTGGAASGSAQQQTAAEEPADDAIKIDQIDWSINAGVLEGRRRALFSYTNNSDYTIVGIEIDFKMRDDATSEEIAESCDYILEGGVSEEELRDANFWADDGYMVEPGEESDPVTCTMGGWYVNNIEQVDLVEPDMMTVRFLVGDMMYEEYYDFLSDSYSLSSDVVDVQQWTDSDLAADLPRPEGALVEEIDESDSRINFDVICMTQDEFDAYVDECREAGFTKDVTSDDSYFYATSEDGSYDLDLSYSVDTGSMTAYFDVV